MANKMLIDASHPEETRVVVSRGKRIEEFDYESASRKQLRGSIYLAKVTRVESSLQAAFVDYGGNRHGFLAFSEIHPDYYQIPVADRQALLEEEAQAQAEYDNDDVEGESSLDEPSPTSLEEEQDAPVGDESKDNADQISSAPLERGTGDDGVVTQDIVSTSTDVTELSAEIKSAENNTSEGESQDSELTSSIEQSDQDNDLEAVNDDDELSESNSEDEMSDVESVGSEDALEELPVRSRRRKRAYKIQEVIRRRQIILVQVVKEERGTKGAALTTYLSLAGRYTVLMPNTARGGGISRKITNPTDRKRLKKIANELEIPSETGLIIRTAGASRTKTEIKRDYEYLLRLWENVRDLTLKSQAPCLVYEEGNLIKRSIRDHYSREIDEVLVAGEEAYKEAKNFMRMIMPSHAKNVQPYKDAQPIFVQHQIERQLNELYSPYVTLQSGGYIVINQTEALVAVDVNSGRATHEHNIEDTALRTNLEAAEEIARQLRLRDLAGLVVIDFIDMDERRNNRAVERKLKECLRNDRARIQVGRISHFGLLEMSRQRLRTGVLEGTTTQCPHCLGTGIIRSTDSVALSVLRSLEDTLIVDQCANLTATTSVEVALYILNQKRPYLKDIEARYSVDITVVADQQLQGGNFKIEQGSVDTTSNRDSNAVVKMDWAFPPPGEDSEAKSDDDGRRKRRRRRRRRSDRTDNTSSDAQNNPATFGEPHNEDNDINVGESSSDREDTETAGTETGRHERDDGDRPRGRNRHRRRGQRGGRRNRSYNSSEHRDASGPHEQQNSNDNAPALDTSQDIPNFEQTPASTQDSNNLSQETSEKTEQFANAKHDTDSERSRGRRRSHRSRRRSSPRKPEASSENENLDHNSTQSKASPEMSENVISPSFEDRTPTQDVAGSADKKKASAAAEDKSGDTPKRGRARRSNGRTKTVVDTQDIAMNKTAALADQEVKPARKGWWNNTRSGAGE
ncbi:MAG: Rne/Rng family ribonuclease [Pseudomonadota bacterium]